MTEPNLDPFAVAVSLAALVVGPALAPIVGAYTLILFGWFGGVLIGLYRRKPSSRMSTAAFAAVTFIVTMGSTVSAAELVASNIPGFTASSKTLLFAVAVAIPAIGDNWVDISQRFWRVLATRWQREREQ